MAHISDISTRLLTRLNTILEWGFDCLRSFGTQERKTALDADFTPKRKLLSPFNKGFCLDGANSLSIEDSTKGCILVGKSGGGKSSVVIIPSCLKMMGHCSMIVHDPSGELAQKVSGHAHTAGVAVKYLHYLKPGMGGFNPLHRMQTPSDISKVANLIIYTALGRSSQDNFWNASACACLKIFLEIVSLQPLDLRTMANVVMLVDTFSYNPTAIDKLMVRANNAQLLSSYKALCATDAKVLASIISTVKAAIELWKDPDVAAVTAYDTIDIEAFRTQPTILFINSDTVTMKYYAVITSILFTQLLSEVMREVPKPDTHPVFFLLDEAGSLNLSGILPIAVANVRKYNSGILQVYQSLHQMTGIYGNDDAKAIRECCFSTLYLPGQDLEASSEISKMLGQFEFETETGAKKVRALRTPDEVRQSSEGILLAGNLPAIRLPLKPYYANGTLRPLTELPPYHPTSVLSFDTPPLIKLS